MTHSAIIESCHLRNFPRLHTTLYHGGDDDDEDDDDDGEDADEEDEDEEDEDEGEEGEEDEEEEDLRLGEYARAFSRALC
jgi:hypothetical protein